MKKLTFLGVFGLILSQLAAQITLKVNAVPANTPAGSAIHVAGNFNTWNAADATKKLTALGSGQFEITFTPPVGTVEFKFTRGSWPTVEGNATGGFLPNRTVSYTGQPKTVDLSILSWEDLGGGGTGGGGNSTAASNVTILDDDFWMPQLNRSRKIWLYLPPDYATSTKFYPVLYMHDGQNLFDASTSFTGEWKVDETLNALHAAGDWGCIVVGIENGGATRHLEYSGWPNANYGGGEGKKYLNFIVETLKPHIDANFRTLPARATTGIFGSSLGGLISQFAAIERPDVFEKVGCFSPAFWFNDPEAFNHVISKGFSQNLRVVYQCDDTEDADMVPDMNGMRTTMTNTGYDPTQIFYKVDTDGAHSEWYWAQQFGTAYKWLFAGAVGTKNANDGRRLFQIAPNPSSDSIVVTGGEAEKKYRARIFDASGKWAGDFLFRSGEPFPISSLPVGHYFLRVLDGQKIVENLRFQVTK